MLNKKILAASIAAAMSNVAVAAVDLDAASPVAASFYKTCVRGNFLWFRRDPRVRKKSTYDAVSKPAPTLDSKQYLCCASRMNCRYAAPFERRSNRQAKSTCSYERDLCSAFHNLADYMTDSIPPSLCAGPRIIRIQIWTVVSFDRHYLYCWIPNRF